MTSGCFVKMFSPNTPLFLKAIIALKRGTQLVKYSRKGKPKFCPFRISTVSYFLLSENAEFDSNAQVMLNFCPYVYIRD